MYAHPKGSVLNIAADDELLNESFGCYETTVG